MKLFLTFLTSFLFFCSFSTDKKPTIEEQSLCTNQKGYLVAFYKDYKPKNDTLARFINRYRSRIIANIEGVRVTYQDSICMREQETGIIGCWSELFNTLTVSKKFLKDRKYKNVFLHEYTHAALKGDLFIPVYSRRLYSQSLKKHPFDFESMMMWDYWTDTGEMQARIQVTRYLFDLWDFKNDRWKSYEYFQKKATEELNRKDADGNIRELFKMCKGPKSVYKLVTEVI